MIFSSFKYLFKQCMKSMYANRMMTLSSIGVLTACLFVTGAATMLSLNVTKSAEVLVGNTEIVAYVWNSEEEKILAANPDAEIGVGKTLISPDIVQAELDKIDNISSYEYISKEQALAEADAMMEEENGLLEDMKDGTRDSVFPASFRIKVKDSTDIAQTAAQIAAIVDIEEVRAPSELAGILLSVKNTVNYVGISLIAILIVVGLVVISNTIRLTVFARRKEINIMKFVGATNAFIRMPFFMEGMTVGLISAVVAFGFLSGSYVGIMALLQESTITTTSVIMQEISNIIPYNAIWLPLLVAFIASGIVVGSIGTAFSIRKHLNV